MKQLAQFIRNGVHSLMFNSNGKFLATGSTDGVVRVFEIESI